ncbi:MAG TPA: hypothetical protein VF533_18410 [Solirubrobacteraceae bacterium]
MKVKLSWPSPAMCVASVALFVALGGTSVAAVSYARNAGKVDGKDAVSSSKSLGKAAGNLVATASKGPEKGRIPAKFLSDVAVADSFGKAFEVADNAVGAQEPFGGAGGIGTLTANCVDQNPKVAVEDPFSTIQFVNQSGETINVTQRKGNDDADIFPLANGTVTGINIGGSNTFELQVQRRGTSLLINGTIRQDGRGQPAASCLIYGTVIRVG